LVLLAAGTDAEQAQALAASGVLAHVPALLADRPLVRQVRARQAFARWLVLRVFYSVVLLSQHILLI
jgi:hypothetical protein